MLKALFSFCPIILFFASSSFAQVVIDSAKQEVTDSIPEISIDTISKIAEDTISVFIIDSINNAVMGRNVLETDILYIKSPEAHIRQLRTQFRSEVSPDTLETLIEYVKIMRKAENNSLWAA